MSAISVGSTEDTCPSEVLTEAGFIGSILRAPHGERAHPPVPWAAITDKEKTMATASEHVQFRFSEGPYSQIMGPAVAFWGEILPDVYRQTYHQRDERRFERVYGPFDARPVLSYDDDRYHGILAGIPVVLRRSDFVRRHGKYHADLYGSGADAFLAEARRQGKGGDRV